MVYIKNILMSDIAEVKTLGHWTMNDTYLPLKQPHLPLFFIMSEFLSIPLIQTIISIEKYSVFRMFCVHLKNTNKTNW